MGGPGSGRYPKGSGGEKDVSKAGIGKHGGDDSTGTTNTKYIARFETKENKILFSDKINKYIGMDSDNYNRDEKNSLETYVFNSVSINSLLRTGKINDVYVASESTVPKIKEDIKNIDTAMEKSFLPFDSVVYRSLYSDITNNLSIGDEFEDKGFVSTSFNKELVEGWNYGRENTILKINISKNTKGIYLSKKGRPFQMELLLNRGTKFKVLKKSGNNIEVEVVK